MKRINERQVKRGKNDDLEDIGCQLRKVFHDETNEKLYKMFLKRQGSICFYMSKCCHIQVLVIVTNE